jgi:superfamily II DNA or RNA helicase
MTFSEMLNALTISRLKVLADKFGLGLPARASKAERVANLSSLKGRLHDVLEAMTIEDLRDIRRAFDQTVGGTKAELIKRVEAGIRGVSTPSRRRTASTSDDNDIDSYGSISCSSSDYGSVFLQRITFDQAAARHPPRDYQREAVELLERKLVPGRPCLIHVATGGGKTRIANDYIAKAFANSRGQWVLWVTKDWALLEQAASDLSRRHNGWTNRLRRWGGDGTILHPLAEGAGQSGTIVYTTLATLANGDRIKVSPKPVLVVWDECHWGADGSIAKKLKLWGKNEKGKTRLLGLTATPRRDANSGFHRILTRDFATLVDQGYLARPIQERVATGIAWAPQVDSKNGDVTAASLRELAQNRQRNQLIVQQYVRHPDRYGKTIVFACNVDHAQMLARDFAAAGVPTDVVHSQRSQQENQEAMKAFAKTSDGKRILVNVAMLTTGFDAPHTRSIFLARPTLSDILFSQMVGRGARKHEPSGKETFHLVEFADTLEQFANLIQRPSDWYGTTGATTTGARSSTQRSPKRAAFTFDPDGQPFSFGETEDVPTPLRGLWSRHGQTFGLEFELTSERFERDMRMEEWLRVAEPLREAIASALPGLVADRCIANYVGFEGKNHCVWNVERDNSCGWEVTTRVLEGEAGMREVMDGLAALDAAAQALGLRVNHSTGTHVHIGWKGRTFSQVKRALELVRLFEPALATLVSPSRIAAYTPERNSYDLEQPNIYCQPLSDAFTAMRIARLTHEEQVQRRITPHQRRYVTLNLRPLGDIGTMEVRLHGGTLDAGKILLWLSLWQQLFWAAENRNNMGPVPEVADAARITPHGDILALARAWLPWSSTTFRQRLHARRLEVRNLWRHPDLTPWLRFCDTWDPQHFIGLTPSTVTK